MIQLNYVQDILTMCDVQFNYQIIEEESRTLSVEEIDQAIAKAKKAIISLNATITDLYNKNRPEKNLTPAILSCFRQRT